MLRPVVITGGGTGGHIYPMMSIAEAFERQGVDPSLIRFVGSSRGQEKTLLTGGRFPLTLLPGRGIQRSLRPRALIQNIGAVGGLIIGLLRAVALVGWWRPRCVISVGGYASLSASVGAVLWRRPLVLVELDAHSGAAHRVVDRFAVKKCTSVPSNDPRTVVTGAPLRSSISSIDRSEGARTLRKVSFSPPIEEMRTVVVVMTGSLGSTSVNEAVLDLARQWNAREDLTIIHVTGKRDFASLHKRAPHVNGLDYRMVDFADMTQLWSVCDVAICRAGAGTLSELTALGIPAVLVPLPKMGDHQSKNAQGLVDAGAATVLRDQDCTADTLMTALEHILTPTVQHQMAAAARSLGHVHADDEIVQVCLQVAK